MVDHKYSENPLSDIWKRLLKYSYGSNIHKETGIDDENIINSISSSIIQAHEYFTASHDVTLNTAPLLMYYGCVNLFFGATAILTKSVPIIENHGATITNVSSSNSIGEIEIHLSGSSEGAFSTFNRIFSNNAPFPRAWKIYELFSYIPDIKYEFEECYSGIRSNCIPIEIVKRKNDRLERIQLTDLKEDFENISIVDFEKAYLTPQQTNKYIILHQKIDSDEIGIFSIGGQKSLIAYTEKEKKDFYLNQFMSFFLGLYSLSMLSRYYPTKWYPFVQKDDTGEKGLIEDFLAISERKLPNLILNLITGKEIHFSSNTVGTVDLSKDYDPDDVKKIVHDEINKSRGNL